MQLAFGLSILGAYRRLAFNNRWEYLMHKFVIERIIPGVGKMSASQLQTVARRSINVLAELGVEIQWVESYICGDKIYCVYLAADEELIREHGRLTGIPCTPI
jgi:hypothetical protein